MIRIQRTVQRGRIDPEVYRMFPIMECHFRWTLTRWDHHTCISFRRRLSSRAVVWETLSARTVKHLKIQHQIQARTSIDGSYLRAANACGRNSRIEPSRSFANCRKRFHTCKASGPSRRFIYCSRQSKRVMSALGATGKRTPASWPLRLTVLRTQQPSWYAPTGPVYGRRCFHIACGRHSARLPSVCRLNHTPLMSLRCLDGPTP